MSLPTPEELMALPPEYLAEVNPNARQMFNCAIGFMIVDTAVLGFYIGSLWIQRTKVTWDMYTLMPLSYLSVLGLTIIGLLLLNIGGVGRHTAFHLLNDPTTITRYLQLQTGIETMYITALTAPKLCILALYLKIFVNRLARRMTYAVGVILILYFIATLVLGFAICQPFEYKWNKSIPGRCGNIVMGYQAISFPSIITDVFILIIPIPTILELQLDIYKKIGVFITFMIGGLGLITAILRCLVFFRRSDLLTDPTYIGAEVMIWVIVESSCYFLCSCLPRIRPLIILVLEVSGIKVAISHSLRGLSQVLRSSNHTANTRKRSNVETTTEDAGGFVQLKDLPGKTSQSSVSSRTQLYH